MSSTLGPKGRTVLIEPKYGPPKATKDGVSVAREVFLEDSYENIAAQLVKESAVKTNEVSGDGTTTATLLAREIFRWAAFSVRRGDNPVAVKKGIGDAVGEAIKEIRKISVKVEGEDLKRVACISANDETIGSLVYEALKGDSKRVIAVEESAGRETTLERVEGLKLPNGFISPHFVTDSDRYEAVLEDALVALVDGKVTTQEDVLPLMSFALQQKKPLLVIAEEVSGEALALLVVNKTRGAMPSAAVKLAAFGSHKAEILDDVAIVTGGGVFSSSGGSLAAPKPEDFGRVKRAILTTDSTVLVGGAGNSDKIEERKRELLGRIEKEKAQMDQTRLKERYSRVAGGVTILKVGGSTDSEIQEAKERVEDAIQATQAAAEEGILPGGGTALAWVGMEISDLEGHSTIDGEYQPGYGCVVEALKRPMEKILENAGYDEKAINVAVEAAQTDLGRGIDVFTGKPVNMTENGVLDPTKVTITALSNAGSIAQLLIGSSTAMTYVKKGDTRAPSA